MAFALENQDIPHNCVQQSVIFTTKLDALTLDKAAQVGATIPQTERAMKQQLKTFLHTTADKIS
ncbi:MAG: hypothetical protein HRU34_07905 [Richelia sp.]|nr:hypothetical protein [Richelia sp.]CDN10108.1 hypothetical protein RintRC_0199 [Richelia intracellularis]